MYRVAIRARHDLSSTSIHAMQTYEKTNTLQPAKNLIQQAQERDFIICEVENVVYPHLAIKAAQQISHHLRSLLHLRVRRLVIADQTESVPFWHRLGWTGPHGLDTSKPNAPKAAMHDVNHPVFTGSYRRDLAFTACACGFR